MAKRKASTSGRTSKGARKTKGPATKKPSRATGLTAARFRTAPVRKGATASKKKVPKRKAAAKPQSTAEQTRARKVPEAKSVAKHSAPPNAGGNTQSTAVTFQWGTEQIEIVDPDRAMPKTKLTKKQLREFREMLLAKRRELVGDMEHLANEALKGSHPGTAGALSSMPIHMADLGSDNWEREFTLGLIENERTLVREIDEALERVDKRTYGVCLATHRRIDTARLRAKPWARYCIEYARLRELGRVP